MGKLTLKRSADYPLYHRAALARRRRGCPPSWPQVRVRPPTAAAPPPTARARVVGGAARARARPSR